MNRLFFFLCRSLACWSFAFTFLPSAPTVDQAWVSFKLSAPGWTLTPPSLLLHFFILLTRRESLLERRGGHLLRYGPGFYFLARAVFGEMGVVDFVASGLPALISDLPPWEGTGLCVHVPCL